MPMAWHKAVISPLLSHSGYHSFMLSSCTWYIDQSVIVLPWKRKFKRKTVTPGMTIIKYNASSILGLYTLSCLTPDHQISRHFEAARAYCSEAWLACGRTSAGAPVKLQSARTILNLCFSASRFHEILLKRLSLNMYIYIEREAMHNSGQSKG